MAFLRIAARNLGRNPRRNAILIVAVTVGIAGTVLSMALNVGLVLQMVETAIATELGHLQIHARGYEDAPGRRARLPDAGRAAAAALAELPAVRAFAPRLRNEGLVSSTRASVGVRVVGVDPARERRVTLVARSVVEGAYLVDASRRVLLGEALAQRLQVGVGDKVAVWVQDVQGDLAGGGFRVGGIFRTASREFDAGTVFLHLEQARSLLGIPDAVSELVVMARERADIDGLQGALAARLGDGAQVRTWEQLQPLLVYLVELFDQTAWIVYAAVFVAMAFGIANVLLMSVYERTREIGIMLAVGMRPWRLVTLVVAESSLLTVIGVGLGFALAGASVWGLRDGLDLSLFAEGLAAYGIGTRVVPVVRAYDLLVPSVVALVTAILASLWPALHAARLRPARALRHV